MKFVRWCVKAQGFARALVELQGDPIEVCSRYVAAGARPVAMDASKAACASAAWRSRM